MLRRQIAVLFIRRSRERGSIMLFVTGLVVVITLITASTLHWNRNLAHNQRRLGETEIKAIEPYNVERTISAVVRLKMSQNDNNILEDLKKQVEENLTYNPRSDMANAGFELYNMTVPVLPIWFNTSDFVNSSPSFRKDNPLHYLWHVPRDLEIPYQFFFWEDEPPADPVQRAAMEKLALLPNPEDTNEFYYAILHLLELPTCQIQLTSVDVFDATETNFYVDVQGTGFFPYGLDAGDNNYGSMSMETLVTTLSWDEGSALAANINVVQPDLSSTWLMEPYQLTEENSNDDFNLQKYYPDSQVIYFDGRDVTSPQSVPMGFSVEEYGAGTGAMKRLVVDLASLPDTNNWNNKPTYYINCTTPLAKQRGVVLKAGALVTHSIITNGALWLEGQQGAPGIITGTHYGGVVFTSSTNSAPEWTAYLVTPVRPPLYVASSNPSGKSYAENISADISGSGNHSLNAYGMNYGTIQMKGKWTAADVGGIQDFGLGFGDEDNWYVYAWLELGTPANLHVFNYHNQQETLVQTIPLGNILSGNEVEFEFTYHRAPHALGGKMNGTPFYVSLLGVSPRSESSCAWWSTALNELDIITRSGGSAFYGDGAVGEVKINGGVLVGKRLTGYRLSNLILAEPDPSLAANLILYSDRILTYCGAIETEVK